MGVKKKLNLTVFQAIALAGIANVSYIRTVASIKTAANPSMVKGTLFYARLLRRRHLLEQQQAAAEETAKSTTTKTTKK